MQYKFYPDNSMFRLNVPNDVPGVEWAREHKTDSQLLNRDYQAVHPCEYAFSSQEPRLMKSLVVLSRSALGEKTPTRSYGWY